MTASTGDRSAVANPEEPVAEVYEWTVLKRLPDGRNNEVAIERGAVLWRQVGIIGSRYAHGLYDETEAVASLGKLAGPGEYLCVNDNNCARMVVVAETVYRRAAEPSDDALAEKMLRDGSVTP